MYYKAYALLAVLMASVALVGVAYAQASVLTVKTDKTSYTTGEDIIITGNVGAVQAGQPVLIQVFSPREAYKFDQIPNIAADGSYTYTLKVGGPKGVSGTYRVVANYAGQQQAETTFQFTASPTGEVWRTIDANIGGSPHRIEYQITGGSLRNVEGDVEGTSLIATIATTGDGELKLRLPRDVIDSRAGTDGISGADEDYIVFVQGEEGAVDEDPATSTHRILNISFLDGDETIEVIGTWIVPEFGTIAAIVLAVAIVGIIVATTRYSKFSLLPRH